MMLVLGLSPVVPEIINDSNLGGIINLNDIPSADPALSPMELCTESQERYVLIIKKENLKKNFETFANESEHFCSNRQNQHRKKITGYRFKTKRNNN